MILSLYLKLYMPAMIFALINSLFFADSEIRGHHYKINKLFCSVTDFKLNFPNRCIGEWKILPANIINTVTLRDFHCKLDDVDFSNFIPII